MSQVFSQHVPQFAAARLLSRLGWLAWLTVGIAGAQGEYETIEILYEPTSVDTDGQVSAWIVAAVVLVGLAGLVWLRHFFKRRTLQLQAQLEQAHLELGEAQRMARLGSWTRNFETGETYWSEEARRLLGLGDAADYRHYELLIHPDDADRVTEIIAAAYYQGGSYQCEHRIICPSGEERYVRLSGRVFLGGDHSPVKEYGTVQDITEHHLAESATQRSEQRLRAVLDAVPYPILIIENNASLPLLFANRATFALFRLDPGQPPDGFALAEFWVNRAELDDCVADLMRGDSIAARETLLSDSQGHHFWAEISGSALQYAGFDALFLTLKDASEQHRLRVEMERIATTDVLTGTLNRRSFLDATQRELRRSVRYRHSFSLMLLDIDHFKRINDHFGHDFGDEVIRRFCEVARACLREEDLLGRIGGEEFAIVLVSAEEGGGYLVAERIRKRWQDEAFELRGARSNFTVSIGVAQLLSDRDTVDAIMERADSGLEDAKRAGRNCVIVFSGEKTAAWRHRGPG